MLKRTPFYEYHVAAGARMVDFAGWEMPIVYRGIIDEHEHTRKSGSIFDVSHMGRLHFNGKDAQAFLSKIITRKISGGTRWAKGSHTKSVLMSLFGTSNAQGISALEACKQLLVENTLTINPSHQV